MAIVTRYFSTTGAGAADGTTWADRAALFSAGNWSTVVTGFDFSGADSLECRIEGGLSYTCGQTMASGLFTNAPSAANPVIFHGCDSSGNLLSPPDAGWVSAAAPFSTSTLPVIATTTNVATSSLANSFWRLISCTMSGYAGAVLASGNYDWISLGISYSNTSAAGISSPTKVSNAQIIFTGTSFNYGIGTPTGELYNVRIDGAAATSSGTRRGITTASGGHNLNGFTIIGCAGGGILAAVGATTRSAYYTGCTLVNNGSYGLQCNSAASQVVWHTITNSYFSGNEYGIDANGSRTIATNNRLRDSTSGNFANFGNYPTDYNYITDSDDATEFVNSGSGDYRIKNTATIWGERYGAGDEAAAGGGGGGGPLVGGRLVR